MTELITEGLVSLGVEAMEKTNFITVFMSDKPGVAVGTTASSVVRLVTSADVDLDVSEIPWKEDMDSCSTGLLCTIVTVVLVEGCLTLVSIGVTSVASLSEIPCQLGAELLLGAGLLPITSVVFSSPADSNEVTDGAVEGPLSAKLEEPEAGEIVAAKGVA